MPTRTGTTPSSGASCRPISGCCSCGNCRSSSRRSSDEARMNPDFVDLLRAFADGEVRCLIVGAYALAVHGRPRATGDLDVWVDPTPDNAANVMSALHQFGAPTAQVSAADFSRPGVVFQMGLPPLRIDVLTEISGVTFTEAWPARTRAAF